MSGSTEFEPKKAGFRTAQKREMPIPRGSAMHRRAKILCALVVNLVLSAPVSGQEVDPRLRLELGDPRFKHQTVDVAPGQIISMESGRPISFEAMIREMQPVPFTHVGEAHDSLPTHELQARIVRALWEQDHRLAIGLEMVPAGRQETLTQWSLGLLTEEEFLREAGWYTTWGFHFGLYRPILAFAKEHEIPLYALDTPREVVAQFRMQDGKVLPEEVKTVAPEPDPAEEESRFLLRKGLESMDMQAALKSAVLERMFEDLYRARVDRETDMASRVVRAQQVQGRKVVVLIGSGHLMFGLGVDRLVRNMSGQSSRSVVPVSVPKGEASVTVTRSLADYIVGVAAEGRPAYPAIGLSFKAAPDASRLMVASKPLDGAARGQDFEAGDIVLAVDGLVFSDVDALLIHLAKIPWGGEIRFRLLRAGVEKTVVLKLAD
jgi:uncharacterized iron-regulated protein